MSTQTTPPTSVPDVTAIIAATAEFYSLSPEDIQGRRTTKQLTNGRHIAMYLCRALTDLSLPQIGQAFGGRDHTTVLHAERKVRAALADDSRLRDQVHRLTTRLEKAGVSPRRPGPPAPPPADSHVSRKPPRARRTTAAADSTAGLRRAQLVVASAAHGRLGARRGGG